jgi:hypothetical protein
MVVGRMWLLHRPVRALLEVGPENAARLRRTTALQRTFGIGFAVEPPSLLNHGIKLSQRCRLCDPPELLAFSSTPRDPSCCP